MATFKVVLEKLRRHWDKQRFVEIYLIRTFVSMFNRIDYYRNRNFFYTNFKLYMIDVDIHDCTHKKRSQWLVFKEREITSKRVVVFMQMDCVLRQRNFNHFVTFLKFLHENINLYMFFLSKNIVKNWTGISISIAVL